MTQVNLRSIFQPKEKYKLIRLGRNNDGGYLAEEQSIKNSQLLLSFGLNDDWSFESHFVKLNNVPIQAFDGSISLKLFFRNFCYSLIRIDSPSNIINKLKIFLSYIIFFKNKIKHNFSMVGYDNKKSKSIPTIFNKYVENKYKKVFLKVDIEGWEYRILDDLVYYADYISGLVIEFHDLDIHQERVVNFINKFSLNLCHCHANNYAGIDNKNSPIVIELSFTETKSDVKTNVNLPNTLDMPNDKYNNEYNINFIN